nr:MAG TPA: hypothetical protein [Caudoviricetes sp.]
MKIQAINGKPLSAGGKLLKASAGGGTAIDLGVTGAAVGDIIKVAAVDADGKPTAWEAAELASGGSVTTEVVTLEEDTDAVTFDLNGCDRIAIVLDVPIVTNNLNYALPMVNSIVGTFITLNYGDTTNRKISVLQLNKVGDELWFFSFKKGNVVIPDSGTFSKVGDVTVLNNMIPMNITSFGMHAYSGQNIPAGTTIYVIRGKVIV